MDDVRRIDGLTYRPGFIDCDEEARLVAAVDRQPWQSGLKRRVQHYGYRYDYSRRTIDASSFLGPLPDWSQGLLDRIMAENLLPTRPDQLIVNEYQPGQGITPHIDCIPCFGEAIAVVSLESGCIMNFTDTRSVDSANLYLERGSLLLLSGDSRYRWKHSIPARRADQAETGKVNRDRRVSLTLRKVLLGGDVR